MVHGGWWCCRLLFDDVVWRDEVKDVVPSICFALTRLFTLLSEKAIFRQSDLFDEVILEVSVHVSEVQTESSLLEARFLSRHNKKGVYSAAVIIFRSGPNTQE